MFWRLPASDRNGNRAAVSMLWRHCFQGAGGILCQQGEYCLQFLVLWIPNTWALVSAENWRLPAVYRSLEKTKAVSKPRDSGLLPKHALGLCAAWAVAEVCVGLHGKAHVGQVPVVTIKTAWRVPRCTSAAQYRCSTRGLCASSGFTLAFYKLMLLATWHHWNLLGWRERRYSTHEQPENLSTVHLCTGGGADNRPAWKLLPQVTALWNGASTCAWCYFSGGESKWGLPAEEHLSTSIPCPPCEALAQGLLQLILVFRAHPPVLSAL